MFSTQSQTLLGLSLDQSHFPQITSKPTTVFRLDSSKQPKIMFRNISRRLSSRIPPTSSLNSHSFRCKFSSFWGYSGNAVRSEKLAFKPMDFDCSSSIKSHPERNLFEIGQILTTDGGIGRGNRIGFSFNFNELCAKGYASMAEAVASSSTDADEDVNGGDEVQKLLTEMWKQERRQATRGWWRQKRAKTGSSWNYLKLKRRQVKIETEAWEQAANEYKELLSDMCEKNLAPNLPYMKSLFLGWFEPLCKRIGEDQELCRKGKHKAAYAPYFDLLPADKMAVITMHKMMGLIMTGGENGCARVVSASCSVGEAIEQEIRIHKFLEKTKTKKAAKDAKTEEKVPDIDIKEQEGLHKKVTNLMKKQKLQVVSRIVKDHDDSKPWTQAVKAQPPADQSGDMPPDIRPAKDSFPLLQNSSALTYLTPNIGFLLNRRTGRRYGVIECDPSVRKGLERSCRHVVIPYMPMLIPPVKWAGYDKGAYLFLPSSIMRIHGAKQQREVLKRTPKENLQPALDTLGITKWRVNKRVLAVVDRIWSDGGCLADFRGRAYPMHPYLNHLGSDLCRGILEFAEGRPIGSSGLQWLKIHLANLFAGGVDKLPLDGRIAFTESHLHDIFDSADRPLDGDRWWLNAEDPFQCLADGSCNGLQHYAALGRDKLGASAVNLVKGERPADVYSGIAARKLVKQTVMTSVYGVTYIGARDQIKKRLQERSNIADDAELFENEPVRWTTPLGLPVVQPYRMYGRHLVSTSLQVLTLQRETEKVMVRRQKTAFPPNFVHSLDGSHMMMTAIACKRAGLNFAGVHDSYWTHACNVDEMNKILREKFLLESFQKSFPTLSFPALPDRGEFDLSDVLQSSYFFN
ncbi:hypothetical protein Ccrd_005344 [Cynara cardunculus var. scolymus]|uniref:DNA-directed RNA polymerase n=1 Tax=Cynara cardunculus var. scolymus TaxID=59895 RepID=A0A103XKX1_CYNCS|nr:hypothetical protein Ccrd_005344 [Cynara cardunculus var. scolymus]